MTENEKPAFGDEDQNDIPVFETKEFKEKTSENYVIGSDEGLPPFEGFTKYVPPEVVKEEEEPDPYFSYRSDADEEDPDGWSPDN